MREIDNKTLLGTLFLAGAGAAGVWLYMQARPVTAPATNPTGGGGSGTTPNTPPPYAPPPPAQGPSTPADPGAPAPGTLAPDVDSQYPISGLAGSVALQYGGVLYLPGAALTLAMGGVPTWDEASQTWGSNMLGVQAYFSPGALYATLTGATGARTITLQRGPFVWTDDHIYLAAPDVQTIWGLQAGLASGQVTISGSGSGGGGGGGHPVYTPN